MPPSPPLPIDSELARLLEPSSESAEAGRDLDGTFELSAFEMLVREPEIAPIAGVESEDDRDWSSIERNALQLLGTSKDLRVAVQLARARLQTHGLPAFLDILQFICALTRRYWASVYPLLDTESTEPTARVNALEELASQPILDRLRRTELAVAPGLGPVSVKDAVASLANPSLDPTQVKAALDALGPSAVALHLSQLRRVRTALLELGAFVFQQSGTLVRLKPLLAASDERPGILDGLETLFAAAHDRLSDRPDIEAGGPGLVSTTTPAQRQVRSGAIASRDDVIATLDRVCAYYSAVEPSSPVPLLLRRAQRLVQLDFLSLVRDLANESVIDIAKTAGIEPASAPDRGAQQSRAENYGD